MKTKRYIGTDEHELKVFVVRSTYADGRPKDLTVVHPEQTVKLNEESTENVFITGWLKVN